MFNKKSNITVIGAGKIAYPLVAALIGSNYYVNTIISRKVASAKTLANKFKIKNYSNSLKGISNKPGIYFLSVQDGQIEAVAKQLSRQKLDFKNSLFIHLSGALNIKTLRSLKQKKASVASFHIMQTFPAKKVFKLRGNFAAIESEDAKVERFLFRLVKDLGLKPFKISTEEKSGYHLAGVFVSNFLSINLFDANQLYKNDNFFEIFNPIINTTLNNIKNYGPAKSLSGPIERGDLKTIKNHLSYIKENTEDSKTSFIYSSYILQSLAGLDVVKAKYGKLTKNHLEVRRFLLKELNKIKISE